MYAPSLLLAFRSARHSYLVTLSLSNSISVAISAAIPQVELSLSISHPASTSLSCIAYASLTIFIRICAALLSSPQPPPKRSRDPHILIALRFATSACAALALRIHPSRFTSSASPPTSLHAHLHEGRPALVRSAFSASCTVSEADAGANVDPGAEEED